nr:zinc finger, CCHC-type [Tanacetum cinerariifolium]
MRIKESLNVTFDESLPESKSSSLVEDDRIDEPHSRIDILWCMSTMNILNETRSSILSSSTKEDDLDSGKLSSKSIFSLCYLFCNPFSSTTLEDANPIRTLGNYSKPSHKGYRNTIELFVGNNVVPLRSDAIRLVQNGCSFYEFRSEDPNQHLKDFLKLVDSVDLGGKNRERMRLRLFHYSLCDQARNWLERLPAGSITTWMDLTTPHTKRIERLENPISKQREKINNRMAEMFRLLKELTTSRASEKELIREEAKSPVTKNVNSISLAKGEEKRNDNDDMAADSSINGTDTEILRKEDEKKTKTENGTKNKPIKRAENEEIAEASSSKPVGYYLKHKINENESRDLLIIIGIVEDALADVAGYVYPMDFVILDIKEDEKGPFILGTPFLMTAKAVIQFDKGTIPLRFGKSKISFHRIPEPLCKVEKGIKNDVEPIAPTMTLNRLVLEWEEMIRLHQEKGMEFDKKRSKNLNNKHPALIKVEGEMNEG